MPVAPFASEASRLPVPPCVRAPKSGVAYHSGIPDRRTRVVGEAAREHNSNQSEERAADRLRDVEHQKTEDEQDEAGSEADTDPLQPSAGARDSDAEQNRAREEEDESNPCGRE